MLSVILLAIIIFLSYKAAPREKKEHAHVHGAGQIGLLVALALFGMDYFTSYFYATGEMMSALHPYGLQKWGFISVAIIAISNAIFGFLYMYSLGIFNEGGGFIQHRCVTYQQVSAWLWQSFCSRTTFLQLLYPPFQGSTRHFPLAN